MLAETLADRVVEAIIAAAAVEIAIASHDRAMGVGKLSGARKVEQRTALLGLMQRRRQLGVQAV
jgi:hypothetical protein